MSWTNAAAPSESSLLTDIRTLRECTHEYIEEGAVTEDYKADRETVLRLLNEVLATKLIYVLHYRHHHFMVKDIDAEPIAAEFLVHANEEQVHANSVVTRIMQSGDESNFNPEGLPTRSHSEYVETDGLIDMIKEDLMVERIATDSYLEMIRYIEDRDPTTRRVLGQTLTVEEEHTDELSDMSRDR